MSKPIKKIVSVHDLGFSYGDHVVLDHISFDIDEKDYVAIVGPNGGGKTTLLKLMLGLLKPQQGSIEIDGTPIQKLRSRSMIGYVPQESTLDHAHFPSTVVEMIESGLTPTKGLFERFSKKDHEAILRALSRAGIEHLRHAPISSLSGGQRQRVFVARALASEPSLLILDEPFVGIDIQAQTEFYEFLKNLNEKNGLTIVFVSHDVDVITQEAKSILCLNKGLLCYGSPEVFHRENMIEKLYGKKVTHIHRQHTHSK